MFLLIIGSIASITSTISLIPQLLQTYKTKSVADLSLLMLVNFLICSICWVIYGIILKAGSVWITNIIMLIFSALLIILKIKYNRK
ncbi:MAG: Sugar transporter SemiSWEET [Candidatus Anoxychlamydiales bacterium]|nr:Sugar transporter SemiSWEET [Candidatus Anoxychlamydiales bacterium]